MVEVTDAFIQRRAFRLAKQKGCNNCYLTKMLSEKQCPFQFIEECCGRFAKIYERIYTQEKRRKWVELIDTVDNEIGAIERTSTPLYDPATITQQEIDDAIDRACVRADKKKHEEYREWMDIKLDRLNKAVDDNDSNNFELSRTMRAMQSDSEIDVRYAIDIFRSMTQKHGIEFLSVTGILDVFMDVVLTTDNPRTLKTCARALSQLAQNGGSELIIERGIAHRMANIVRNEKCPIWLKMVCAETLGWVYGLISIN